MIQMPSVRPVPWAATSGGVQAVSAVRPPQPVVAGRQDSTDPAAHEASDVTVGSASTAGASQANQAATQRVTGHVKAQPMDLARERELRREQARQLEEQADRDREAMERLRAVLTNVWEASAAVVEQALSEGNETALTSDVSHNLGALTGMQRSQRPALVADKAAGQVSHQGAVVTLPGDASAAEGVGANGNGSGVVLGYDERGIGSPDRLAAGRIISQRV
ncbi:hypothetical protein [Hydrogenophaga sp.]|uniref:hypothetical protein n=1 Tax=Hydrogenophaga sp. TaxID=1904254 RepID=UPI0035AD8D36